MVNHNSYVRRLGLVVAAWGCWAAVGTVVADEPEPATDAAPASAVAGAEDFPRGKWQPLFDGKSLAGWKPTQFGGEGEVTVAPDKGELTLNLGSSLTGITYDGKRKLPTVDYEIRLEAKRTVGSDFFCGLTVPYKKTHFSLIVGGWGGGLVGISSIDGMDASENETGSYIPLKDNTWYPVRVRVRDGHISAWVGDNQVANIEVGERELSTRIEVDLSKPLGIATWETTSVLRNLELRRLEDTTIKESK